MKDYYKILNLGFGANVYTVKKAYRQLALKYHPDKNKEPYAAQKFIKITEAYEVLRDLLKKEEYDRLYQINFGVKQQNIYSEQSHKQAFQKKQEWADFGKQKAKEYSSIPFEEFARKLLKEVSVGISYIPNIIAIFIVFAGAIGLLSLLPNAFNYSNGVGFIVVIIIIGLIYTAYRLFIVARSDYKEEREIKIFNRK